MDLETATTRAIARDDRLTQEEELTLTEDAFQQMTWIVIGPR